ncbi:DUF58 domain-containing protein [Cryobacterium sinapicolor]|uniref:DUF58 domain-containing protein n=1 Tax=Cryobacterium sinapicolor TaxID=1259236 RepID=A0ABY2JEW2_9MICO|nr:MULTISPECIES: DUF58 domain-containing protein [Cryobacterium]TFC82696.1 DUF58 domain-containing protein [Cryobacterium sp. TMT3-29-2]TFD02346.1 DUF58 domain-containing protein [Cryobacterium sinapicolor]
MPSKQRRARFPRLTFRGGMFLAAGAGLLVLAVLTDQRDLLFVAGLLLGLPVAALGYVSFRPVRLRVTRILRPPVVPAGGEMVVRLGLRNLSSRPVAGLHLRDTVRLRDAADLGPTVLTGTPLPALERYEGGPDTGADSVRFEYRFSPPRRGLYASGPVLIGRSDPFGLASGEWAVGEPNDLVATPRVTALAGGGLTGALNDGDVPERLRRLQHNADPLIAREYRPGDPLRRVNWPATARRGEIMVRQEEEQSNPGARLVLDTALRGRHGRPSGAAGHSGAASVGAGAAGGIGRLRLEQAFEVAVEVAASVGVHLLAAGYRLDLIVLGPSRPNTTPARPGGGGLRGEPPAVFLPPGGVAVLLEGLAGLVPTDLPEPGESAENTVDQAYTAVGARVAGPAASVVPGSPEPGTAAQRRTLLAPGGLLPTFAVLVAVDDRDLTELAELVSQTRPAVAFLTDTVDTDAVRRLGEAGWRCIPVRQARDIPRAWEDFIGERRPEHDAV